MPDPTIVWEQGTVRVKCLPMPLTNHWGYRTEGVGYYVQRDGKLLQAYRNKDTALERAKREVAV